MLLNRTRGTPTAAPPAIVIDGDVLSHARISGIGHTLGGLVHELAADSRITSRFRVRVLAPLDGVERVRSRAPRDVEIVRMPFPIRGWDRLMSLPVLPPLDALVGRGVFVFPHFANWPLRNSRSITFVHDLAFLRHPETVGGNQRMLLHTIGRWIARSDVVATVSRFSAAEIAQYLGVADERCAVIPWGVDERVFHRRGADEVDAVSRRHGLPQRYVLHLGDIAPRKNLARLVRAYRALPASLRREHPLVLAGGGSWNDATIQAEIDAAVAAGDDVRRLHTYVEDDELPALLSGATLLAHPSLYEGFGVAPLQAMACGIPVVAGANSAQLEVVADAGILVDALDEHAIATGLERVLADGELRDRLVQAGQARARLFSWRRTVDAFVRVLETLYP